MKTSIPDKDGVSTIWAKVKNRSIPVKTLTKADYDILDADQKNADIVYVITNDDVVSDPISVAEIEKMISQAVSEIDVGPTLEEYDTSAGWHVRKWSDGYVEMSIVRSKTIETSEWETWGSDFCIDPAFQTISYPFTLTKLYHVSSDIMKNSRGYASSSSMAAMHLIPAISLTYAPKILLFRPAVRPESSVEVSVSTFVSGRWK